MPIQASHGAFQARPLLLHNIRHTALASQRRSTPKRWMSRRLIAQASSFYSPFPFDRSDYLRASLQLIQVHHQAQHGFMLFQLDDGHGQVTDQTKGLLVAIGGDVYQAINLLLQGREQARPLTVELLWRILERGQDISKKEWSIMQVAITDLSETAFLGRIWFGNRETGETKWDVDCRPSDATWLALKCGAPIYIHKAVWESTSTPLDELKEQLQWQMANGQRELQMHQQQESFTSGGEGGASGGSVDVSAIMTKIRQSDPEPLKLLKRELQLAIAEEDYTVAARIRDHPFLRMHVAAMVAREGGDMEAASRYEHRLRSEIARYQSEDVPSDVDA